MEYASDMPWRYQFPNFDLQSKKIAFNCILSIENPLLWCRCCRRDTIGVVFLFLSICEGTKGKKRPADNSTASRKAKQQKIDGGKGKKNSKEKPAVKRASSAYIYFSKDFRIKLKEKLEKKGETIPKVNEVAKLAGDEWRKLSAEDKKPYEELARKDRERYLKEVSRRK